MTDRNRNRKQNRRGFVVEGLEDRGLMAAGVNFGSLWGALGRPGLAPAANRSIVTGAQSDGDRQAVAGIVAFRAPTFRGFTATPNRSFGNVARRTPTPPRTPTPRFPTRPTVPPKVVTPTPTPTPIPTPPPVVTPTPTPTPGNNATEQAIFNLVNQNRQQQGLAPLSLNAKLNEAAKIQADQMVALRTMDHNLPGAQYPGLVDRINHVGYRYATAGENIAYGYSDANSVMNGWMNSSGHRANILNTSYTEMGVAVSYTPEGIPYYAQVFGRPANS